MPVVRISHRPKSPEQRRRVAERIIAAVAEEWQLEADLVQVFFEEYDDTRWFRGEGVRNELVTGVV